MIDGLEKALNRLENWARECDGRRYVITALEDQGEGRSFEVVLMDFGHNTCVIRKSFAHTWSELVVMALMAEKRIAGGMQVAPPPHP